MSWVQKVLDETSAWIDQVATAVLLWRETLRPPRFARLVEQENGVFIVQDSAAPQDAPASSPSRKWVFLRKAPRPKAEIDVPRDPIHIADGAIAPDDAARLAPLLSRARVELVLRPDRFLFRPLQLPRRATDFLEGIIRAQIDRLTPWSAAEAAFGWLPSADAGGDRMTVTIAATARGLLSPYVEAIRGLDVEAVIISTPAPEGHAATIRVLEQKIEGAVEARRMRRGLTVAVVGLAAVCVASIILSSIVGSVLDSRREEIVQKISERRAVLEPDGDANSAASLALQQKKHATPASVLVYDELSRILPDNTYLTEMRIEGDKLQIVGLSPDAPELIHLMEKSPHFTHAAFFAPTTRTPSESRQHFFIEAHIEPVFAAPEAVSQ